MNKIGTILIIFLNIMFVNSNLNAAIFPVKPILVSPSGIIQETIPEFKWNGVTDATWYKLYLSNDSKTFKFVQWYEVEDNDLNYPQVNCVGGECYISVSNALEAGNYTWWIRGWNDNGTGGGWSDGQNFTIQGNGSPPSKITILSPSTTLTGSPEFVWNEDADATWYKLYLSNDSKTFKFAQWYEVEDMDSTFPEVNCTNGQCRVNVNSIPGDDIYDWWVKGWNEHGSGDWSNGLEFSMSNSAGGISLSGIQWESMNGPIGGDTLYAGQDPYQPDTLYCSTSRGLYLSQNKGENWELIEEIDTNGINQIAYSKNKFFVCGEGKLYSYDRRTNQTRQIDQPCKRVFSDEDTVFITTGSMDTDIVTIKSSSAQSDTFSWTSISPTPTELASLIDPYITDDEFTKFSYVSHLFSFTSHIIIGVVVTSSDGTDTWIDAKLFSSTDNGETWSPVTIDIPPATMINQITQNPADPDHLMMTLQWCSDNSDQCSPPDPPTMLDDLLRVSHDGGLTWEPLIKSELDSFAFSTDSLYYSQGIYYLTGFNDGGLTKLSGNNFDQVENLGYPNVEGFGPFGITGMFFDTANANTVYGYDGTNGVIRSDDNMMTWTYEVQGIISGAVANISIHPTDANIIAVSNIGMYMAQITRDGGETWEPLKDSATYTDELVFDIHNPNRMLLMDEISKFKESSDAGENWKQIIKEFNTARVSDFHISDKNGGSIFAAILGEGIVQLNDLEHFDVRNADNTLDWTLLYKSPDYTYDIEPHPSDDKSIYATYSPKKFENFAAIYQGTDNGEEELGENIEWTELLKVNDVDGATSISVDQNNPDNIYAGFTGDKGFIYTSTNKGTDWSILNNGLTFATIHAMAVDPTDENTVFAAPWGGGLYISSDTGQTWQELKTPTTSIVSILVDSDDSNHLFIGDRNAPRVYESFDQGQTWHELITLDTDDYYRVFSMVLHNKQLHFSVMNKVTGFMALFTTPMSGSTFRLENDGTLTKFTGAMDRVVLDFSSSGDTLFAVAHISGIFKLNADTWEDIADQSFSDIGFGSITSRGNNVYVTGMSDLDVDLTHRIEDTVTRKNRVNKIYMSSDKGENWTSFPDQPFDAPVKRLLLDSDNSNILYAATVSGLWVSADGGSSWKEQNSHLGFKSIGAMVAGKAAIYAGTLGGGVYPGKIETDQSITWSSSTGPYPVIYNIQIKVDPTQSDTIYATAYPGGVYKTRDRGQTWREMNFALPSFQVTDPVIQGYYTLEIDPYDADTLYLGIFQKGVYKSNDGAQTWAPVYGDYGQNAAIMKMEITRIIADPMTQNKLYLATRKNGVWVSDNGAENWTKMNDGLNTLDVLSLNFSDTGTLYAGTDGYGIYYYDTITNQWVHMGRTIGFGQWWPWERSTYQYSALLFDPTTAGKIYLGHFPSGFFISEDNGLSWEASNLGLGNDGIFSLTLDPDTAQTIWAGTYNGVAKSVNSGMSWTMKSTGMPEQQWPFDIVIDDKNTDIMYVATKNGMNKGFCDRNEFCGVVLKSIDGGENWERIMTGLSDMDEFYSMVIHPDDHNVLFLSTSNGVYATTNAGTTWESFNTGLPVTFNQMRGNVGQTLKLSQDKKYLILGINFHGVWRADISNLLGDIDG